VDACEVVFVDEIGCYRRLACADTCFGSGGAGREREEKLASAQSDEHGCEYARTLRRKCRVCMENRLMGCCKREMGHLARLRLQERGLSATADRRPSTLDPAYRMDDIARG
jgi:hypothetical protein